LPESANAEMVTDVVQSIDDVVDSQLLDVYHGGQINKGMISITLRYEVINPHAREKVEALLKGFGGIIR
ncbi:MAG TPA: prephenate dehydrogenase, partial [Methanobacterium sp.]|nr:prephenate dehydrogenase [Methanobacterium sp.]